MSLYLITFVLLFGASALGFGIAFFWVKNRFFNRLEEMNKLQRGYSRLRTEYDELNKKNNTLIAEKGKYKNQIENSKAKLKHQKKYSSPARK